jgi:hypothetical protein
MKDKNVNQVTLRGELQGEGTNGIGRVNEESKEGEYG